jgi:hypothetical protein
MDNILAGLSPGSQSPPAQCPFNRFSAGAEIASGRNRAAKVSGKIIHKYLTWFTDGFLKVA